MTCNEIRKLQAIYHSLNLDYQIGHTLASYKTFSKFLFALTSPNFSKTSLTFNNIQNSTGCPYYKKKSSTSIMLLLVTVSRKEIKHNPQVESRMLLKFELPEWHSTNLSLETCLKN